MTHPINGPADASLTPRPGRPGLPVGRVHVARGTWFLVLIHAGVAALLTGAGWPDLLLLAAPRRCAGRSTTVGYHRYFSHRASRRAGSLQFLLACLLREPPAGPAVVGGHHRHHHRHSDTRTTPTRRPRRLLVGVLRLDLRAARSRWGRSATCAATPSWSGWSGSGVPPLLMAAVLCLLGGWSRCARLLLQRRPSLPRDLRR